MSPKLSQSEIHDFRRRSMVNGYGPIRVKSRDKRPVAKDWTKGESYACLVTCCQGSNTGLLASGLRVIDIDVDDRNITQKIIGEIRRLLPRGALIRKRSNSPRLALVYRAMIGKPGKLKIAGPGGAIEVLGDGQQFVAHGIHPTGTKFEWAGGKSPASVPVGNLGVVTEADLFRFLRACQKHLGHPDQVTYLGNGPVGQEQSARVTPGDNGREHPDHSQVTGNSPAHLAKQALVMGKVTCLGTSPRPDRATVTPVRVAFEGNFPRRIDADGSALRANLELTGGIDTGVWFTELTPNEKGAFIKTCLDGLDNTTNDPRDRWLEMIFALKDAEAQGCHEAYGLGLAWSRRGRGWTSEHDFDIAWNSAEPGTGVTVGTLIYRAKEAGLDVSSFRANHAPAAREHLQGWAPKASAISDFFVVPPKRPFVFGTDIIRGAVTVVVAPGARGKTSLLTAMAISCASNRSFLQEHIYGGPLRVLYINAEDPIAELWRRFYASLAHHQVAAAECANLNILGAEHGAFTFLENNGGQPCLCRSAWDEFEKNLEYYKPDVVFIDPLAAVFGGVSMNDNSAAALLMTEFTRIAARNKIAIVIAHHSAKGRDLTSPEAAMGGAMTMNTARVGLSIEPMTDQQAGEFGIPECDASQYFRLIGTKQNMSSANTAGRWHRLVQTHISNAEPPTYPTGDTVAVVERVNPTKAGFSGAMIQAVLDAIRTASPPLSPTAGRSGSDPIPVIEAAMSPFVGGRTSVGQAKALLKRLLASGNVVIGRYRVSRGNGHGGYERQALIVPLPSSTTGGTP